MHCLWERFIKSLYWMLKLKIQYFGYLICRADSVQKILILGKTESERRRGQQRRRWLDGTTDSWTWIWANFGRPWRVEEPVVLQSPRLQTTTAVLFTRQGELFSFYFLSGLVTNSWLSHSNFFHILSLSHSELLSPEFRHHLMLGHHWNKGRTGP